MVLESSARQTPKTQILWKCWNRSRITPVQRNRSSVSTPMRKSQWEPTGFAYKTNEKPMILWFLEIAWGRLGWQSSRPNGPGQTLIVMAIGVRIPTPKLRIPHALRPEARQILYGRPRIPIRLISLWSMFNSFDFIVCGVEHLKRR